MEQPINQTSATSSNNSILLLVIITTILTSIIVGGGIFWWMNQKQTELNNEIVSLRTEINQLKQTSTSTPIPAQTQTETQNPAPTQTIGSNIFTYKSKPGDKVGDMILSKINHPTIQTEPANPDYVYAEFTGTITITGRLSAPTGNPEDGGIGPEYLLSNLTQDSLERLPYLQNDTKDWFGVKNPDVMKNSPVKNGDMVEITINKYEYRFFPAAVWNEATVVAVKKI